MKNVFRIFRDDVAALAKRFFASAVIIAISVLPALYAWVNIYANGNPYANTGSIKIALASEDPGIDLEDGRHINMAEEVFDEMRESDKIGWQFPAGSEEAIEGVRSGEYYAAVVFEKNFTYNMYHFDQALLDKNAPLTYYENGKKNAVASKITETAAGNLQESIKTKYLETVFGRIFDETNEISDQLAKGEAADAVISQLESLRDTLLAYDTAISSFTENSADLKAGLNDINRKIGRTRASAKSSAAKAEADLARAQNSVLTLSAALDARKNEISRRISALEEVIDQLRNAVLTEEERAALEQEALRRAERLKADLEALRALFPDSDSSLLTGAVRSTLDNMISTVDNIMTMITDPPSLPPLMDSLKKLNDVSLEDSVASMIKTMQSTLDRLDPLAYSISGMIGDIGPVIDSAGTTVDSMDKTLAQTQKLIRASADDIDSIIKKVNEAGSDERLQLLIDLLGGDPERYAEFFSSLVDVKVTEVYSVASYGAAMAPFYSVLAIWVGGVILVSILKTHVDRKKYPGLSEAEYFFGRFILFFVIGQAQAAVIVAGDIFLLGCAPVHPWLMWLCAAVTSLVFELLIYALTISFGDIGKAMVVVVMVLQIAGSSGSYPIEILPVVFGKIYKFFPFPYAINAIREALCGTYGSDMLIYLGELLIFGLVGLAIGLFVRKPFIGLNDFVTEKLEETEVL